MLYIVKKTLVSFLVFFIVACSTTKKISLLKEKNTTEFFKIKKINYKMSYFIIYAQRNDSIFKIISDIDSLQSECTPIKVRHSYQLNLKKTFPLDSILGIPIAPNLGVIGLGTEQGDIIKVEKKSHYKIYIATNLKGLCINSTATYENFIK